MWGFGLFRRKALQCKNWIVHPSLPSPDAHCSLQHKVRFPRWSCQRGWWSGCAWLYVWGQYTLHTTHYTLHVLLQTIIAISYYNWSYLIDVLQRHLSWLRRTSSQEPWPPNMLSVGIPVCSTGHWYPFSCIILPDIVFWASLYSCCLRLFLLVMI